MVSLLANNVGQVDYSVAYRSFALSLVVSAALLLVVKWLLRDWQKAGVFVTVMNILFFSYGHVYSYVEDAKMAGEKMMNILSAYLFPGAEPDFYPSLTPVNNFRLVFNSYFHTSLPVLPDRSFYVDINHPHVFDEMEDPCTPSQ